MIAGDKGFRYVAGSWYAAFWVRAATTDERRAARGRAAAAEEASAGAAGGGAPPRTDGDSLRELAEAAMAEDNRSPRCIA